MSGRPTNALVTASGEPRRHYTAAIWCGVLAIGFGLLAPGMVRVITTTPAAYVAALGGLAMLKPLQGAFQAAFVGSYATGALVTFLVTVSDITVWHIGAAFWGLLVGATVSLGLERERRVVARRRSPTEPVSPVPPPVLPQLPRKRASRPVKTSGASRGGV